MASVPLLHQTAPASPLRCVSERTEAQLALSDWGTCCFKPRPARIRDGGQSPVPASTAPRPATSSPLSWSGHCGCPVSGPTLLPCLGASHMITWRWHFSHLSRVSSWKGTLWSTPGSRPRSPEPFPCPALALDVRLDVPRSSLPIVPQWVSSREKPDPPHIPQVCPGFSHENLGCAQVTLPAHPCSNDWRQVMSWRCCCLQEPWSEVWAQPRKKQAPAEGRPIQARRCPSLQVGTGHQASPHLDFHTCTMALKPPSSQAR